jgi:hypothetical protein
MLFWVLFWLITLLMVFNTVSVSAKNGTNRYYYKPAHILVLHDNLTKVISKGNGKKERA